MKLFSITMTLMLCAINVNAQQNIFKNRPWEGFEKKNLVSEKLKQLNATTNNDIFLTPDYDYNLKKSILKIPLKGDFIANTGKGTDLYVMNTDKMPCIVHDNTYNFNMPVAGYDKYFENNLSHSK